MEYDAALAYWFGRIDHERRQAAPGDWSLERMRALLRLLGDPHHRLRIVHITGSKGKGSTAAFCAAILRAAGYRVGLYTSPHLTHVEERVQVNGVPISRAELAAILTEIAAAEAQLVASGTGRPSFFEVSTAIGFVHFVWRRCDWVVLEVGLGGRFDATNVCRPQVSLITSISHEHTRILGEHLHQIAFEKAGIIKHAVPVVSGALDAEAQVVIARIAHERHAPLLQLGREVRATHTPGAYPLAGAPTWPTVQVTLPTGTLPAWPMGLLGAHQADNAALAVAALQQLVRRGVPIAPTAFPAGLAHVHWPARMEVLGRRPFVIVDCAHNGASAQALVETLRQTFSAARRWWLVFAVAADKDLAAIATVLAPHFAGVELTRFASSPRSVAPTELQSRLATLTPAWPTRVHESAPAAYHAARAEAGPDDLICIAGSVYLAGELRPVLVEAAHD